MAPEHSWVPPWILCLALKVTVLPLGKANALWTRRCHMGANGLIDLGLGLLSCKTEYVGDESIRFKAPNPENSVFSQCRISKSSCHRFTYQTCRRVQGAFSVASPCCWLCESGILFFPLKQHWEVYFCCKACVCGYFAKLIIVKLKFWIILMFLENVAKLPCGTVIWVYTLTVVNSTFLPTLGIIWKLPAWKANMLSYLNFHFVSY